MSSLVSPVHRVDDPEISHPYHSVSTSVFNFESMVRFNFDYNFLTRPILSENAVTIGYLYSVRFVNKLSIDSGST